MRRHRAFLILLTFAAALFLSDIWIYKEFVCAESYFALGARLMILVAVIWERELTDLAARDSTIRVLAQAETYGNGGLTLKLLRNPKRDTLLVIGHDR